MDRYIRFNGIEFGKGNKYLFSEFNPNDCNIGRQEYKPIEKDGIIVGDTTYNARVVSLKGTIIAENRQELFLLVQQLTSACNGKTVANLIYFDGINKYQAEAIADLPVFGEITLKRTVQFNINFTIPKFYWNSFDEHIVDGHLESFDGTYDFNVEIGFTDKIYPIITIFAQRTAESSTITITNKTNGNAFSLILDKGYNSYYVDTEYGTVTKNQSSVITDVSEILSDFTEWFLVPNATNKISVKSTNATTSKMRLTYRYRYVGV